MILFKTGKFEVITLGQPDFFVAEQSLLGVPLTKDRLKIALNNVYTNKQLSALAMGDLTVLRPVQTVLAGIILEQLREECLAQIQGVRRAFGPPLTGDHQYQPQTEIPETDLDWQDEGNLFCTTNRLVMPSNKFTFIRLGRKIATVKAFRNGIGIQLKKDERATYFVGCYAHEAAVVTAYAMGKLPQKRGTSSSK